MFGFPGDVRNMIVCKALHTSRGKKKQTPRYWNKRHKVQWDRLTGGLSLI